MCFMVFVFFFQAEDGIRDLVRSRGLGDVYKRQEKNFLMRCRSVCTIPKKLQTGKTGEEEMLIWLFLSLIHI